MVNIPNSNQKAQVVIESLAHKETVQFFPYDFEFDDSYKPEWTPYDAFGRMDPIMTYKRTTRDVTLSFNVVAEDSQTAKDNFDKLQVFIKCLYPIYSESTNSARLSEAIARAAEVDTALKAASAGKGMALLGGKVKGATLLTGIADIKVEAEKAAKEIASLEKVASAEKEFGIQVMHKSPLFRITFMNLLKSEDFVAAITNFKHKMKFDSADTSFSSDGNVIPGEFNISISFKILHTYIPGSFSKLNYK